MLLCHFFVKVCNYL